MILKITLLDKPNESLINQLRKEHIEKVEGIAELYDSLYMNGKCESHSDARIYYVAYTLAANRIPLNITEIKLPQTERYCTVEESLKESLKEMRLIREGKLPKLSLSESRALWKQWAEETEDDSENDINSTPTK